LLSDRRAKIEINANISRRRGRIERAQMLKNRTDAAVENVTMYKFLNSKNLTFTLYRPDVFYILHNIFRRKLYDRITITTRNNLL